MLEPAEAREPRRARRWDRRPTCAARSIEPFAASRSTAMASGSFTTDARGYAASGSIASSRPVSEVAHGRRTRRARPRRATAAASRSTRRSVRTGRSRRGRGWARGLRRTDARRAGAARSRRGTARRARRRGARGRSRAAGAGRRADATRGRPRSASARRAEHEVAVGDRAGDGRLRARWPGAGVRVRARRRCAPARGGPARWARRPRAGARAAAATGGAAPGAELREVERFLVALDAGVAAGIARRIPRRAASTRRARSGSTCCSAKLGAAGAHPPRRARGALPASELHGQRPVGGRGADSRRGRGVEVARHGERDGQRARVLGVVAELLRGQSTSRVAPGSTAAPERGELRRGARSVRTGDRRGASSRAAMRRLATDCVTPAPDGASGEALVLGHRDEGLARRTGCRSSRAMHAILA